MGDGSIHFDVSCTQCGYNLRGLNGAGQCPECGQDILASLDILIARGEVRAVQAKLNRFDKLCAILAILLGVVLLGLGAFGVFGGISASFTLPPVLGILPAIIGWGILRSVRVAWKAGMIQPSPDQSTNEWLCRKAAINAIMML